MTETWSEEKIVELMDEAFAEGPGAPVYAKLQEVLRDHPEHLSLWEEYQILKRGMEALENSEGPSEFTVARIRQAARKHAPAPVKVSRGWRVLLSQPIVAAATVVLIVGFGIYSQFWMKEQEKGKILIPREAVEQELELKMEGAKKEKKPKPALKTIQPTPKDVAPKAAAPKKEPRKPEPPQAPGLLDSGTRRQLDYREPTGGLAPSIKETLGGSAPQPAAEAQPAPPSPTKSTAPAVATPAGYGEDAKMREESPTEEKQLRKKSDASKKMKSPVSEDAVVAQSSRVKQLVDQARSKMKAEDFNGALEKLLEAQKIQDSPEIRRLIDQCRAQIRLIENKRPRP